MSMSKLSQRLTHPATGEDAKNPIDSSIATCPKETNKIYIALTIDDGPRSAITPKFVEFLDKNNIPATWYIVRTNVEAIGDSYYKTLKGMQDRGHEIAIHEALPEAENTKEILSGVKKDAEHIPVFPTDHKSYGKSYYKDVNDWARHIKKFKNLLSSKGINAKFIRIPGGVDSQLRQMKRKMKLKSISTKEMIEYINKSRSERDKKTGEPYDRLNKFASALKESGLKSWGGGMRSSSKEKALNYITALSWTSEISSNESNVIEDLEGRLRRFNKKGKITNPVVYPYSVVLTHDNKGYFDNFKKTMELIIQRSLKEKNARGISFEFVTMSKLYRLVGCNPDSN